MKIHTKPFGGGQAWACLEWVWISEKNNCTWQQLKPPNLVPKALLWEQLLCLDGQRLGLMMVMMV